ncbi:MAG TPA: ferritin-like domain-containing protein [Nitrospirota bacterium]|nr:ferritin-like domain-containing protein [Nitrospirota bacterium]
MAFGPCRSGGSDGVRTVVSVGGEAEGTPIVSNLGRISIGADASKQLASDHALELGAIKAYNQAIKLAGDVDDFATREILEDILQNEDAHVDRIEALQDQIGDMTLPMYLTTQVG